METKGTRVMFYESGTPSIGLGTDDGQYAGTIEELNVRKLTDTVMLPNLPLRHQLVADAMAQDGYGCGWGSVGKLFPVSAEQVEQLIAADKELGEARERKQAERLAAETARLDALAKAGLCPKCGTFCDGDCGHR